MTDDAAAALVRAYLIASALPWELIETGQGTWLVRRIHPTGNGFIERSAPSLAKAVTAIHTYQQELEHKQ